MLKRTAPAELIRAIREMVEGGAPMSGLIARKVVSVFQVNDSGGQGWNPLHAKKGKSLPDLSNRENEILQQLVYRTAIQRNCGKSVYQFRNRS